MYPMINFEGACSIKIFFCDRTNTENNTYPNPMPRKAEINQASWPTNIPTTDIKTPNADTHFRIRRRIREKYNGNFIDSKTDCHMT